MKSKITLLITLLLFDLNNWACCQDSLLLKNGTKLFVKITEVDDSVVEYKLCDAVKPWANTRTFISPVKEIAIIKYESGAISTLKYKKFSLDDEQLVDQINYIAKYCGESIVGICAGLNENVQTSVYFDTVIKDEKTLALTIPIKVSWLAVKNGKTKANEDRDWIKGTITLMPDGKKKWELNNESNSTFGRTNPCPKTGYFDVHDENTIKRIDSLGVYCGKYLIDDYFHNRESVLLYQSVFVSDVANEFYLPIKFVIYDSNHSTQQWTQGTVYIMSTGEKVFNVNKKGFRYDDLKGGVEFSKRIKF